MERHCTFLTRCDGSGQRLMYPPERVDLSEQNLSYRARSRCPYCTRLVRVALTDLTIARHNARLTDPEAVLAYWDREAASALRDGLELADAEEHERNRSCFGTI